MKNESIADRTVRALVGLAILAFFFFGPETPWALIGLYPLLTAIAGFCPLYALLGIRTYHRPTPPPVHPAARPPAAV